MISHTELAPLPLADAESMDAYAVITGSAPGMVRLAHLCPVKGCGAAILVCDNRVWLNAKPVEPGGPYDPLVMGVMQLGHMMVAAGGDIDGGSGHMMHEHQPPEAG